MNSLPKNIGPEKSLFALRHSFPSGSIVSEILPRISVMARQASEFITEKKHNGVLDQIANEVARLGLSTRDSKT